MFYLSSDGTFFWWIGGRILRVGEPAYGEQQDEDEPEPKRGPHSHVRILRQLARDLGTVCRSGQEYYPVLDAFEFGEAKRIADFFVQLAPQALRLRQKDFHYPRIELLAGKQRDFFASGGNRQGLAVRSV